MSLHNLIANGGKVLIVGGYNHSFQEFRNHPQLVFWSGEQKEIERKVTAGYYPEPLKAVVISRFISHKHSVPIIHEARKKNATIFAPLADGEVKRTLNEIISGPVGRLVEKKQEPIEAKLTFINPKKEETKMELRRAKKGELSAIVKQYDVPSRAANAVAADLLKVCQEKGINSSVESIANVIRNYRIKLGLIQPKARGPYKKEVKVKKEVPAKIQEPKKPEKKSTLLILIDDTIASLQLIRDEVIAISEKSSEVENLKKKITALLGE